VRPAAHREVRLVRHPGGLHRDVGGGVADAEHDHALAREHVRGPVVVRVQLLPRERLAAREARLRPPRVPVVAVRDDHVVVVPRLRHPRVVERPQRDVVPAVAGRAPPGLGGRACRDHLDHLGAERDPLAQAEVLDELVEVRRDLPVARVVRKRLGHREGGVLHRGARGVDVQRAVRRADAVVVLVAPVAADRRAHLEAVEVDPAGGEDLGGGDAGRAGADDADAGPGGGRHADCHRPRWLPSASLKYAVQPRSPTCCRPTTVRPPSSSIFASAASTSATSITMTGAS
jgi:hypothetical protein